MLIWSIKIINKKFPGSKSTFVYDYIKKKFLKNHRGIEDFLKMRSSIEQ